MMNKRMIDMEDFALVIDKVLEDTICKECPIPEEFDKKTNRCRYCTVINIVRLFGVEQMLDSIERRIGGGR